MNATIRSAKTRTAALFLTSVLFLAAAAAAQETPAPAPTEKTATEKTLRARVEATQGKERGAANAELAKFLDAQSRWSDAAAAWRQARRLRGDVSDLEAEARTLLAFAGDVFAQGEQGPPLLAAYEDAKAALRRARDAGSKSLEVSLGLAKCAEVDRDPEAQVAELRRAVEAFPADPRPKRELAAALSAAGKPAEALPILARLSEEHPLDAELALSLASAAKAAGDEDAQRIAAMRVVAAAPDDARGWGALWSSYAAKQRWGELANATVAIANAHPKSMYAAHYAGMACGAAKRVDEALTWLEKAWTLEPRNHPAKTEAARLLRDEKNDRARAIRLYEEVLAVEPANRYAQEGLFFVAKRLSDEGNPADAAPLFGRVAAARPEDPASQANYALALRWAGRYADSEKVYQAAIAATPGDAQVRNDYGLLLLIQGREKEAREALLAGHAENPLHNDCMENLGFLAEKSGNREEALKWFRAGLEAALRRGEDGGHHRITVDSERWPLPPLR